MNLFPYVLSLVVALLSTPLLVLAQDRDFKGVVNSLTGFLNSLIPLLGGAALVVFFWGLIQYISQSGSGEEVEESKRRMIWGVLGLFVIAAVWGIVYFIGNSLGIT